MPIKCFAYILMGSKGNSYQISYTSRTVCTKLVEHNLVK